MNGTMVTEWELLEDEYDGVIQAWTETIEGQLHQLTRDIQSTTV